MLVSDLLFFYLYFPIYKPKIPKIFTLPFIYLYQISLLQVIVKGLTTPLSRWVQVVDCLCRYSVTCALSLTRLIPWFSKLREILMLHFAASPSPLRGKPTQAQDIARRISGAVSGEVFTQVKTHQVPITNSSPSHLHYLPFASRFPLPHFTFAILFALSFPISSSLFFLPFFCLLVCWITCCHGTR